MRSARLIDAVRAITRRRRLAYALVAVVVVAVVALPARELSADNDADARPTIPKYALRINITPLPISRPIPSAFVGFSIEYRSLLPYSGRNPASPNPTFIQLVRALTPGGSPVIRFGGDTTDWTWWPTPGVSKPPGIRYTLNARWVSMARATAHAMGARLILGINFEADDPAIAATEARALLKGLGRKLIAGFELGNEPEAYGALGWYDTAGGVSVPGRPVTYGFGSYLRDYAAISSALPHGVPLVGPASGAPAWIAGLNRYLGANPRVRLVTFHRYPLHRCFTPPGSPTSPTIPHLLSRDASVGPAASLQGAVAVAHRRGLQFRVDELNDVSCGGARGVSNTFASALWVLDALFNMAKVGADGVNIHTFTDAVYGPFTFAGAGGRWEAHVKPMYYGLLMFARAAPAGSRLLLAEAPGRPNLRVWAARARDGTIRIVLINDARNRAITVAVRSPGASAAGTLERLRAPGLRATAHVAIAGQTFGARTATGELSGSSTRATLHPIQDRYVVQLPPASAALITLARS
ncbi:MAG: hypothetical protein JOZ98_13505 [Solirubrobacterales bacterium]|nr:hypothetical protein [Solirubrobacterales bacterium]MBV9796845.1 hypothetical protein [Solirubrobacterales bacterium]